MFHSELDIRIRQSLRNITNATLFGVYAKVGQKHIIWFHIINSKHFCSSQKSIDFRKEEL